MKTMSLSFPAMFDVSRNQVGVFHDNDSIVNRTRLLIMSEVTSLYDNPNFGVGLKRHLWKYNTPNERALIGERIRVQLELHEPCVDSEKTQFMPGLITSGNLGEFPQHEFNQVKMTCGLQTIYNEELEITDLGTISVGGEVRD